MTSSSLNTILHLYTSISPPLHSQFSTTDPAVLHLYTPDFLPLPQQFSTFTLATVHLLFPAGKRAARHGRPVSISVGSRPGDSLAATPALGPSLGWCRPARYPHDKSILADSFMEFPSDADRDLLFLARRVLENIQRQTWPLIHTSLICNYQSRLSSGGGEEGAVVGLGNVGKAPP